MKGGKSTFCEEDIAAFKQQCEENTVLIIKFSQEATSLLKEICKFFGLKISGN